MDHNKLNSRIHTCMFGAPVQGIGTAAMSLQSQHRRNDPNQERASDIRHQTGAKLQKPIL